MTNTALRYLSSFSRCRFGGECGLPPELYNGQTTLAAANNFPGCDGINYSRFL